MLRCNAAAIQAKFGTNLFTGDKFGAAIIQLHAAIQIFARFLVTELWQQNLKCLDKVLLRPGRLLKLLHSFHKQA